MTDFNWNLWLDEFNILHLHENPKFNQSENGLTFTGSLHVLWKACGMKSELPKVDLNKFMILGDDNKALFLPTPKSELNSHYSLDNDFGFRVQREFYSPELELPISRWYKPKEHTKNVSKYWLRPDTLIYNALLEGNQLIRLIAKKALFFACELSCKKPKDNTSGKRLWFDRFLLLSLSKDEFLATIGKEGLELMDKLLTPMHGKRPMIDVIDYYFKNPNHPCRKLIRLYYCG